MKYPVLFDVRKLHIAKKKKKTDEKFEKVKHFFSNFAYNINVTSEKTRIYGILFSQTITTNCTAAIRII